MTGHFLGWGAAVFLPMKQYNFGRGMGAPVGSRNRARPAIAKIIFIHTHTHPCRQPWREPLHSQALACWAGCRGAASGGAWKAQLTL